MATVTTTLTNVEDLSYFSGTGSNALPGYSYAPLGQMIVHSSLLEAVALAGAGDNQRILVDYSLPANFSWSLVDFRIRTLTQAAGGTNNWPNGCAVLLANASTLTATINLPMAAVSLGSFTAGPPLTQKIYTAQYDAIPDQVMRPLPGDQLRFTMDMYNATAADAAYYADWWARFLMFDIAQSFDAGANSPIPTR